MDDQHSEGSLFVQMSCNWLPTHQNPADDRQPAIRRRAEVPLTATLKPLHDVTQAAMLFDDYHLFEFRRRQALCYPYPEWDSLRDKTYLAKTMRLETLVDRGVSELAHNFDFGDDWRHGRDRGNRRSRAREHE